MTKTTPSMVRDVSAMLVDTTTFLPIAPFGFRPGEGSKILKGGKDEFEVVWGNTSCTTNSIGILAIRGVSGSRGPLVGLTYTWEVNSTRLGQYVYVVTVAAHMPGVLPL